jgi:hypothetical protein
MWGRGEQKRKKEIVVPKIKITHFYGNKDSTYF